MTVSPSLILDPMSRRVPEMSSLDRTRGRGGWATSGNEETLGELRFFHSRMLAKLCCCLISPREGEKSAGLVGSEYVPNGGVSGGRLERVEEGVRSGVWGERERDKSRTGELKEEEEKKGDGELSRRVE